MNRQNYQKIFAWFWIYIGLVLMWSTFQPLPSWLVGLTLLMSLMAGAYWHYILFHLKNKLKISKDAVKISPEKHVDKLHG